MNKYVLIMQGVQDNSSPEAGQAWMEWFQSIGDSIIDSGNPFGAAREVTSEGASDLAFGPDSFYGYTIVQAENMDAAEKLLDSCPLSPGARMRIYEAIPM